MSFTIRPVSSVEFFAWHELYEGYNELYEAPLDDARAVLVWTWLTKPDHAFEGFVAEDETGKLIGLAHVREFYRPVAGEVALYLDDLYVHPDARGQGVGTALIEHLRELAKSRHLKTVRWITAEDNETARRVYDKVASKTEFVTYDLTV